MKAFSCLSAAALAAGGVDITIARAFFGRTFSAGPQHEFGLGAGFHWQAFKNIGFGLYYNAFILDVDVDKDDWRGKAEAKQHGPWLAITATW
jgi:hypothetical protein